MLGVPNALIKRGGFAWAAAPRNQTNPWSALSLPVNAKGDSPVPVVLDLNTANYSLHLWGGLGEQFPIEGGDHQPIHLDVAGLLDNSIFQGDLLMSESSLLRIDPSVSGYRFFLIDAPQGEVAAVRQILERTLGDYGFATETTGDRLAGFLAVQNTYLSTFQSLGGLGLLLGTIGLAAVQLRNVLERRGELALLRAAGFRRRLLGELVVLENLLLLAAGLGIGVLAALVAVLPHVLGGGASIPWGSLAAILGLVLVVGLVASLAAVRWLAKSPLLDALRSDR
jgi:ABC-type antimicrobial peptide transport system permease subunit